MRLAHESAPLEDRRWALAPLEVRQWGHLEAAKLERRALVQNLGRWWQVELGPRGGWGEGAGSPLAIVRRGSGRAQPQ